MAIGQMPNWVQFHIKVKLPYRFKNSFLFVFEWLLIRLNIWKRGEKRVKAIGAYVDTGTLEQSMQLLVFCLLHPSSPSSYTCKPTNTEEERKPKIQGKLIYVVQLAFIRKTATTSSWKRMFQ